MKTRKLQWLYIYITTFKHSSSWVLNNLQLWSSVRCQPLQGTLKHIKSQISLKIMSTSTAIVGRQNINKNKLLRNYLQEKENFLQSAPWKVDVRYVQIQRRHFVDHHRVSSRTCTWWMIRCFVNINYKELDCIINDAEVWSWSIFLFSLLVLMSFVIIRINVFAINKDYRGNYLLFKKIFRIQGPTRYRSGVMRRFIIFIPVSFRCWNHRKI